MQDRERDWTNILFLVLSPIVGLVGTAFYASRFGVAWWEPVLFLVLFASVGVAIGAGYHRCFSHRTYECHPAVEAVLLFLGAFALQNSALRWSRDHRNHHRWVDTDRDPYNIRRGALWAHVLWVFYKDPPGSSFENVPDLLSNPRVMWQHRWYRLIGVGLGLGLPTLVGALFGRPIGGLLWGGFLRVVLVHHTTFLVNSAAHLYGSRPYSTENSARDNWLLAFFTHGEGYHNFHHRFPSDFRNGVRWYQWDPNKWCIQALRLSGLARNLRVTPPPVIENAKLAVLAARADERLARTPTEGADEFRARLERGRARVDEALQLWKDAYARYVEVRAAKARGQGPSSDVRIAVRRMVRDYERRFRSTRLEWVAVLESFLETAESAS
ncbi:MAG TPA: fatty acid desaturase [Thermoanaerobaculia bacterium]|nr:fatty acid desaturase [Thermoanaerobaculia bacterium]